MTVLAWSFALLAALLHVVVFAWEALLFQRPSVHQGVFATPTADVPAVRLWAFGVGFYNLFLACGVLAGVLAWALGEEAAGRALVCLRQASTRGTLIARLAVQASTTGMRALSPNLG